GQENGAGSQHGSEQRQDHFVGPPDASLFCASSRYRFLDDVVQYDNAIVDHHSDPEDDPGQRNDVDTQISQIQKQNTDGQTQRCNDAHDHRNPYIAIKKKDDQGSQQTSYPLGGFHIANIQIQ